MNRVAPYFFISSLCIYSIIFFSVCQKEYSYEGGDVTATQTAVYKLVNTNGSCYNANISGNYYKGVQLSQLNTTQLLVDVSKPGTYNLITNTAAGFKFFVTGNFTERRRQSITLSASGTPSSIGNFNFKPVINSSFAFAITVAIQPPGLGIFTLEGAPGICINPDIIGHYTPGIALQASNILTVSVNVASTGAYYLYTDTLSGISFSASGTFTKTGNQTIALKVEGTPVGARYLSFTIRGGNTKCSFDLPIIYSEPLAIYVLESDFGTRNPWVYTVEKSYNSNTLLSGANTLTMKVFVTVSGYFTVATNIINGMIFSYSGSFTTQGSQFITLSGSGTSVSARTYIFAPQIVGPHPLGGQTCAFDIDVSKLRKTLVNFT